MADKFVPLLRVRYSLRFGLAAMVILNAYLGLWILTKDFGPAQLRHDLQPHLVITNVEAPFPLLLTYTGYPIDQAITDGPNNVSGFSDFTLATDHVALWAGYSTVNLD